MDYTVNHTGDKVFMKYLSLCRTLILFSLIVLMNTTLLTGQEAPAEALGSEAQPAPTGLIPIFPEVEEGLIYVEGESAVSTNFATSAVSNYGASGFKSLQLIQQNAPYGGQSYFAEYAFYAEEEGDYAFWYGGTPPGPLDSVYPSFASPFRYTLDDQEPVSVYRENLEVNQAYTPAYYWMEVAPVHLTEGIHRIRFEVPEKRRYDGRFYFFLDAFFFLRQDRMEDELVLVPDVFPRNRTDRSIDNPFQSFSYYEKIIQDNPGNKDAYIVLSMIYSLAGDYINALKNLNKAVSLDPEDPYPLLLTAKNRIWNGETAEGLSVYGQLLTLVPDNASYWAEAGKVAAWTGNYRESIDFFTRGLEQFPDDLNLKVNLGLTYLWMSRSADAESEFREAEESTAGDHDRAMDLGRIHKLNGYPQYAVNLYIKELSASPRFLETYLNLEESYREMGETDRADDVIRQIYDSFESSPALSRYMTVYEEKKSMKDGILQDYLDALAEQPDNIPLRQLLSQTYFWNGLKEEAVDQSLKILINKLYISIRDFDEKAADILALMDRLSRYQLRFAAMEEDWQNGIRDLTAAGSAYDKAVSAAEKKPEDEAVQSALESASAAYAAAYGSAGLLTYRMGDLDAERAELEKEWAGLQEKEEREESVFRQLLGEAEWTWDRGFNQNELRRVQRTEPFLAGYILSRLALFGGKPGEAALYLESDVFREDIPSLYGLYESYLWGRDGENSAKLWAARAEDLSSYRGQISGMETDLRSGDASARASLPLPDQSAALMEELSLRAKTMKTESEEHGVLSAEIRGVLDKKLVRQIYYYEQDTYLLRYSLGEYYLDMEENLKATEQFERVLAMDPSNISANYKLGIVSQRYGDWYRAMIQYRKVYEQNPRYENAAYYYNQLARRNADALSVDIQNITDPSRINYNGTLNYQSRVNTRLGWGVTYHLDMDRKYRVFGDEVPNQYKLHSLSFNVPYQLTGWNLTVTPEAGLYAWNDYFGVFPSDTDFGSSVLTPGDVGSALNIEPLLGIGLGWKKDFLDTNLGYRYKLEEESLFSDRSLTRSHRISAGAGTYFPLESLDEWGPVTTRTYAQMEILTGSDGGSSRMKGQILQEGTIGYIVNRAPLVRMTANALVNFENGSDAVVQDYYLPRGVLEAKGGLRGSVNFHNAAYTEALELSLFGSIGGYWTDVVRQEDLTDAVKLEGLFSLYYVRETMTFFLNISGNGTFNEKQGLSFWEFSALLGARVTIPSLLAN